MDDVPDDQCSSNQSGSTLAQVAVELNSGVSISKAGVPFDERINAGVRYINAVLALRVGSDVILDQNAVFMTGENPPGATIVHGVILDDYALSITAAADGTNAGPRDSA